MAKRPNGEGVEALFVRDGQYFIPTPLTQGPWSPDHQFGGAPAALAAQVVEAVPALVPMQVARLTIDLLRPVPIAPLVVDVDVRRQGKRIQVIDVGVHSEGVEVARVAATRLRVGDIPGADPRAGVARQRPPTILAAGGGDGQRMSRVNETLEYACADPAALFVAPSWARLKVPVIAGEPTVPLARMAYVADACSGVGERTRDDLSGINVDITLNVIRPCAGEWLCVEGASFTSDLGIGISQAIFSDERGVVGSVSLSRLVDRVATAGRAGEARDHAGSVRS